MDKISRLPVEILLEILEAASQSSNRNTSLIKLATVCRAFTAPALCLLFERLSLHTDQQARDYLREIEAARDPLSLATRTRRLSITYRTNEDDTPNSPTSLSVRGSDAMKVFYLLKNLTHFKVDSDDEYRTLESAMRRRGHEEGAKALLRKAKSVELRGKFLRWDRLVNLVEDLANLRGLYVEGLYDAGIYDVERRRARNDFRPTAGSTGTTNEATQMQEMVGPAEQSAVAFAFPPSLDRPASPHPDPSPSTSAFPQFTHLRRLVLDHALNPCPDQHLLSIVGAVRHSLESFAVVRSIWFSREALLIALRNLRNLAELELTHCSFGDHHIGDSVGSSSSRIPPSNANLVVPDPRSASTEDLDLYTFPFDPTQAIARREIERREPGGHFMDYPFEKELLVDMVVALKERLKTIAFEPGMLLSESAQQSLRAVCQELGIAFSSKSYGSREDTPQESLSRD
ncbi:hypothetical protein JCM16303_005129 [Sporobolomyces ruberrimus]